MLNCANGFKTVIVCDFPEVTGRDYDLQLTEKAKKEPPASSRSPINYSLQLRHQLTGA
jgi:hypothetical protein